MPLFELLFSAQLTNVKEVLPANEDTDWYIKVKCTNCGEIHEKFVSVNSKESIPIKDIVEGSIKPYTGDNSEQFRPIVRFSCTGLEPVEYSIRDGWQVTSSSTNETVFSDVDLSSGEWTDFDDNAGVCLEIMEIQTKFKLTK